VLPKEKAEALLARLGAAGLTDSAIIGRVSGKGTGRILMSTRGSRPMPERDEADTDTQPREENSTDMGTDDKSCCSGDEAGGHISHGDATGVPQTEQKFREFMKSAGTPGALDAATKQAVAIALSVLARCDPCVKAHIQKARSMGFSQEEIDETAWMAVSFGGSPVMMFYNSVKGG
jgi:AhpD family alkylhydroperoxidase